MSARRPDIQGLRAIAVLLVVAFHAGLPIRGGFVGVDVFFVISGFVIARLLVDELSASNTLDLRLFYARRVRRLLPALAVLLVVTTIASSLLLNPFGPQQATANTSIGASLFGANVQLFRTPTGYFDLAAEANPLLHTWSLSVEEQFYFAFPGCLLLAWRFATRRGNQSPRRLVAMLVAGATCLSFALSLYTSHGHGDRLAHFVGGSVTKLSFYMPVTRAWEFGIGILVALAAVTKWSRTSANVLAVLGLGLIGVGAIATSDADPFPGWLALLPVFGTATIIAVGSSSTISSFLSLRPLVWVGDVSYGWYLWHWPLIVFVRASWPSSTWMPGVAAVVALGFTVISYWLVENPLRRDDRLVGRRSVLLVALCVGLSLTAAFGLRLVNRIERSSATMHDLELALTQHADEARGCSGGPTIAHAAVACTWSMTGGRGTVFLVGDSNAGQFSEPAAAAANKAAYTLAIATRSACPFIDAIVDVPHHDGVSCREFVLDSVAALVKARPALVIIASSSNSYINADSVAIRDPASGVRATSRELKARIWATGVQAVVTRLTSAGIPTVLIHTVPQLEGLALATCPFYKAYQDVNACGVELSRREIEDQQRLPRESEERAISLSSSTTTVDFTGDLCSPEACFSRRKGIWLYRDSGHLSVQGALELTDRFEHLIADHAHPQAGIQSPPESQ